MKKELKVGDKFVVVGWRTKMMNCEGKMDKYLGQILTVRGVEGIKYKCLEDINECVNGWDWYNEMIDWEATEKLNNPKPIQLLESGMVVEFANERKAVVLKGDLSTRCYGKQDFCVVSQEVFMNGSSYNDELCESINSNWDIIKIHKPNISDMSYMFTDCKDSNLIWERTPEQKTIKLTSSELLEKLGLDKNTKVEIEW